MLRTLSKLHRNRSLKKVFARVEGYASYKRGDWEWDEVANEIELLMERDHGLLVKVPRHTHPKLWLYDMLRVR